MTNTRPQLDNSKSPSLTNIASNTGVPQNGSTTNATLVSDLISATSPLANFSDVDGDSAGLVITGINTNGTLYYSTNGGATWQTVMSLTSASALALLADANTYVYFRPNAGYSGTLSDAITFRAWDGTDGSTNGQVGLNINPAQIGALDTTGNVYDVAVVGNYAYVTDNGVGLKIIDVSDPSDLKLVGSINAAGVLGISVVGNYAYVAASDVGLQVFNIGNPSAPSLVGTRDTSGYAYDVAVVGNYAYVADWNAGLQIINISVPSNPSIVGTYNTSGMASAVAVVGNYAYVADYSAGLQIINVSTPSAPNLVSTLDTPGTANDVAVVGDYAYVADDTYGLQIINISNPSNPSLVGTYNTSNDARGVTVVGDIAYVAIGVFGLQMINISDPSNPTLVGSYDTSGYAADVAVVDNIAYVADYAAGLKVLTVQDAFSSSSDTASVVVANTNDAPTGTLSISGTATQGQTLSASNTLADVDGLGTMSYQWLADGEVITGAIGATFTLGQDQVGKAIRVKASYTDGQGTAESVTSSATSAVANTNDAPTGTVTITGTAMQGQTLTASNTLADADGLGTISYQWLADGQAITGATSETFTLTQAQVGKTMTVKASYTDGQGTAESVTSSATSAVANVNDAPTGTVTISGTATQGQMLTASNTLADADGLGTMSYQWLADGQAITGATESTYTLSQAEVGKAMTVKASYTDGQGTAESVTSSATSAVADTNDSPTFSATGANPTFTELLDLEFETLQNTNLTYLFTNSNFDTIEAGQEIIQATITVTNVEDKIDGRSAEYLLIGGSFVQSIQIALQDGNTGSSSSPDLTYSVSVDKYKTATVVINSADTPMVWEQYASLLAYFNVSQNPMAGERVVTVTGLKDNGGTEDGGQDTTSDLTVSSTVNVVSVNDAPVNSVATARTTNEDTAIVFSTANANAITVSDVDSNSLTTTLSIPTGKGTLSITATGHGATVTNNGSISVQITGTATQINTALEGLTYTPTANANGATYTSLTIATSDTIGQDSDTVDIAVTAVDDAPVASSMAASVSLNSKQLFSAFTPVYSDVESDTPQALKLLSLPTTGSFEVYDGSGDRSDDSNWTTVTLGDNNNTVISSGNPLTIVMSDLDNYRFNAGNSQGTANVDWQIQTNGLWSNTATGVVTIVDSANNTAPVVNIYDVSNSDADLSTGTLTVAEDGISTQVKLVFSDDITPEEFMQGVVQSSNTDLIDMSCISMTRTTTTTTNDTVLLTFTPKANAYGSTTITLGASDGDKSTTKTFTLVVTPTNEQAVAQDFLKTIDEDGAFAFSTINPSDIYTDANDASMNASTAVDYASKMADIQTQMALLQDADTANDASAQTAIGNIVNELISANLFPKQFVIDTLPTHGNLSLDGTTISTTGYAVSMLDLAKLSYAPTANYHGTDSFTWHAVDLAADGTSDGLSTAIKTATFTVTSVNDAPTGTVTINGTATQGQTLTASNTLADADGLGTMSYQWLADGQAITGATSETFTLTQAQVGKTMTVKASYTDGQGTAESVTSSATSAVAATPAPTQPPVTEAPTPAPTEPPVTEAPTPAPVTSTVDGTMVQTGTTTQTRTTTDATGQTVTTTVQVEQVIVTPVTDTRIEDTTTPSSQTADIPLFWGESTRTEWATTASLPVGVGITTEGTRSPDINQDIVTTLTQLIEETAPETDGGKTNMLEGGVDFLATLAQQSTETLVINKVTLTTANDATQPASVPIVISGTANNVTTPSGNSAPPVEALVIDTRQLPAGSILDLQNIEFAVIVGDNVTIRGGEGANILFAGTGGQNIRLGADDDELHAGDGDDWVGSQGGNDQIFGEEGNDVLYGGVGNDTLDGGTGIDIALFQYALNQYQISQNSDGSWTISHSIEGTDTLININFAEFSDTTITLSGSQWLNQLVNGTLVLF